MSRARVAVAFLSSVGVALHLAGCSVVGFTVGAVADAKRSEYDTLPAPEVMKLAAGDSLTVTCARGSTPFSGQYLGLERTRPEQYKEYYALWQKSDSVAQLFPSLEESVRVRYHSPLRKDVEGVLLGFDPGMISLQVEGETETIGVEEVREIAPFHHKVTQGETLRKMLDGGTVPFMSSLRIASGADTIKVPLYAIIEMRKANSRHQKWTGLAVGALGDAFLLGGLYLAFSGTHFMGGK